MKISQFYINTISSLIERAPPNRPYVPVLQVPKERGKKRERERGREREKEREREREREGEREREASCV
jgi:hypothetical protein